MNNFMNSLFDCAFHSCHDAFKPIIYVNHQNALIVDDCIVYMPALPILLFHPQPEKFSHFDCMLILILQKS